MRIKLQMTEEELTNLVIAHLSSNLGEKVSLTARDVKIEVKSKQNYKSEWEVAAFRAVYEGDI